jgi:hypothetical protein
MAAVEDYIRVELSWPEVALASQVGCRRMVEALRKALPDAYGCTGEDGWTHHVQGAMGEMAFAKATGRYWDGSVNTFKAGGDVGTIQVRTRSEAWYDLLIRPDARPEDIYVLVRGTGPAFEVAGWCFAGDVAAHSDAAERAGRPHWRKAHGGRVPAYFVPNSALRRAAELVRPPTPPGRGLAPPGPDGAYPPNAGRL